MCFVAFLNHTFVKDSKDFLCVSKHTNFLLSVQILTSLCLPWLRGRSRLASRITNPVDLLVSSPHMFMMPVAFSSWFSSPSNSNLLAVMHTSRSFIMPKLLRLAPTWLRVSSEEPSLSRTVCSIHSSISILSLSFIKSMDSSYRRHFVFFLERNKLFSQIVQIFALRLDQF